MRRFFRILPVAVSWIFLCFFISMLISHLTGSAVELARWVKEIKWFFSGFYNYFFASAHGAALIGHYWSLAVEMHFYFILPFLLIVFRTRKQRIALCIISIIAVSTVLRLKIVTPSGMGFLTHTQADALFVGVLIAVLYNEKETGSDLETVNRKIVIPQLVKNVLMIALILILFVLP